MLYAQVIRNRAFNMTKLFGGSSKLDSIFRERGFQIVKAKYIPNILSLFRILFSASLLLSHRNPVLFIVFYFALGASDVLDGRLARHNHWQSELGAKLDGLGDVLFFLCAFASMLLPPRLEFNLVKTLTTASVPIALKLFVLFSTRLRFKEWNGMHTYLNKFFGLLLFFSVPLFVWMGEVNYRSLLVLAIAVSMTAVEEAVTLFTADCYDPNHKGIFVEKLLDRRFWSFLFHKYRVY
jgi:phosphatidylglycerophosphate synthase